MNTMAGLNRNIVQLNNNNYPIWRVQVVVALKNEDLWSIVSGQESEPTEVAALAKYRIRANRALGIVCLNISPELIYVIGDDPCDPKVVWQVLADTFQRKTFTNKFQIKRKLYNNKLGNDDDVQLHLKGLAESFSALSMLGDPVGEEDKVILLLSSLSSRFDPLVTALEALEKVPSWEMAMEKVISESVKHGSSSGDMSHAQALHARHKKFGKNNFKRPTCFECGQEGHMRPNCPKLQCSAAICCHNYSEEEIKM